MRPRPPAEFSTPGRRLAALYPPTSERLPVAESRNAECISDHARCTSCVHHVCMRAAYYLTELLASLYSPLRLDDLLHACCRLCSLHLKS